MSSPHPFPIADDLPQNSPVPFQLHHSLEEPNLEGSIVAPEPESLSFAEDGPLFSIVPNATKRGGDVLVEKEYCYIKDGRPSKRGQRWRCCVRNKTVQCLASGFAVWRHSPEVHSLTGIFSFGLFRVFGTMKWVIIICSLDKYCY